MTLPNRQHILIVASNIHFLRLFPYQYQTNCIPNNHVTQMKSETFTKLTKQKNTIKEHLFYI